MKKRTKQKDTKILFTNNYPYKNNTTSNKKYTYMLGIGGNIGNTKRIFDKLFLNLKQNSFVFVKQTSFLYINPPFGYLKQNNFTNTIVIIKTNKSAKIFLEQTKYIEKRFKRERLFKDAPRSLDIDIIVCKKGKHMIKKQTKNLQIPHKHWKQRHSVIVPLRYIKNNR
ncbi:MAG: 2-amino-4-hydroxy-6-hydroxymethyldihydropteridine diphosphokinase [Epsilonproteobacteria bacterium]|nr:MAG: 2-amino-4-hydroxy-6-hydroxymethyldihydropteridine diphosphokinase [Campylobacterota bacterium]